MFYNDNIRDGLKINGIYFIIKASAYSNGTAVNYHYKRLAFKTLAAALTGTTALSTLPAIIIVGVVFLFLLLHLSLLPTAIMLWEMEWNVLCFL